MCNFYVHVGPVRPGAIIDWVRALAHTQNPGPNWTKCASSFVCKVDLLCYMFGRNID